MNVVHLKKLAANKAAMRFAQRGSLSVNDRFDGRYNLANWDDQALVVMDGEHCRGIIVLGVSEDIPALSVDLAYVDPAFPQALIMLLAALRKHATKEGAGEISFTCHEGNEEMARCVDILGAKPVSRSYRLDIPTTQGDHP